MNETLISLGADMLCAEAGIGAVLQKIISVDAVCAVIVAACLVIILFIPKFVENRIVSIIVIAFALVFAVTTITAANRYYENQILPDMSHEKTAESVEMRQWHTI